MMHDKNNNFVIAVLSNGKVLREVNGTVYLPFNSEYSIRIKNPNSFRVGISVSIDGTEINTHKIIVNSHSDVDLKRMCVDGDLNSGPALKFVPISHSEVQDPSSRENGVLQVSFYKEMIYMPAFPNLQTGDGIAYRKGTKSAPNNDFQSAVFRGISKKVGSAGFDGGNVMYSSNNIVTHSSEPVTASTSIMGATIAGNTTVQKFSTVDIALSSVPCSIMSLTLRGVKDTPVFVNTPIYCTGCGRKFKHGEEFCSKCGRKKYLA